MHDIRELLKKAARRIELSTYLECAHWTAIIAAALALALMVADRAFATSFMPWFWVAPGLVVLVLGIAAIAWSRRRRTEVQVALAVDERLDLREKLTTALYCEGRDDPFAQAAVEDGVHVARDPRTKEHLRRRFGITAPRGWWFSPLLLLVTLMISLLSPLDLFSRDVEQSAAADQARLEVNQQVQVLVQDLQQTSQLKSELSGVLDDLQGGGSSPDPRATPEELRRDAIKKMTDLNRKLEEILSGEKGKTAAMVEDAMSQLKPPTEGPAKELAEAMAAGDFDAAKKAMQDLMDKIQAGELDEQQKKQLAEQMQNLADQLNAMAQQQDQLREALKQAGMDPNLANNPQALQQQLQNNQNLNDEQKQQLQQMAQAQQQAQKMCQGLGQACQQMAQGMQGAGQMGQLTQAGQQMMNQLNDMEAMQQLLQEAQAAMNMCQGQCQGIGQGLSMQQAMQQWQQGGAFGNRGQGAGGKAPRARTPAGFKNVKAPVKTTEGDIIARQLVEGPQRVGESTQPITQVALREISDGYDDATIEDELPRKYEEPMKHYFGELEKQVQAQHVESLTPDAENAPAEPSEESPE